jgi:uncharacterized membrane protein YgcG
LTGRKIRKTRYGIYHPEFLEEWHNGTGKDYPINFNSIISSLFYYSSFIIILFLIFPASVSAQDFMINEFHADIIIRENSSFIVKETIDVEFHRAKHGIFREIPFKYADDLGKTVMTPLHVLSVTDITGNERKYTVQKRGDVLNIRIGDPTAYVEGKQIYVITYDVENALLFFNDHDEFYWNITGNYWQADIRKASATVVLTGKNTSANLRAACYTGRLGSRSSDCRVETSHNSGEFYSTKYLPAGEGFTVAFGWDKGIVSPPASWLQFLWTLDLRENWIFFMPFVSLIFMTGLWHSRGRDPRVREAVTVRYEPPKYGEAPLTSAEVGTIIDEKLDARDITSTIVGLAVKGYIRIEEIKNEGLVFDSTDYYLTKVKGADEHLSSFETLLMDRIFTTNVPGIMVSAMKNKFYADLEPLRNTVYGELTAKKYFLVSPEKIRRVYIIFAIFLIITSGILFVLLSTPAKGLFAGILTGLPALAFSKLMPAKTKTGASVCIDSLGFQEFLNRAEKDRLERMNDKDLFSRFLPYAIALDVVDNWARAFEGIYQEPPQWFRCQESFSTFSPYRFSRSITSATSNFASVMYSAPRGSGISSGSGSGGGGSSGGGFGGGGGGSW